MRCRVNASLTIAVVVLAVSVVVGASAPSALAEGARGGGPSPALHSGAQVARVGTATAVRPASDTFGRWLGPWGAAEAEKHVRAGAVLAVRPAADAPVRTCNFGLQVSGRYDKPDFTAVMREEGIVVGTSTCGAELVPMLTVDATIDDFGMPGGGGHQIATGSNWGSGPGPVVATVAQDVMLVQAPPPDNYRIEWTFHLHATSVDGQQATACAKLQAVFPGDVTTASC